MHIAVIDMGNNIGNIYTNIANKGNIANTSDICANIADIFAVYIADIVLKPLIFVLILPNMPILISGLSISRYRISGITNDMMCR